MSKYVNIKCGHCDHSFSGGYKPGYVSVLGVSRLRCPSCLKFNRTSARPYSRFDVSDKVGFWFGRIVRILILGPLYGGSLGWGISELMSLSLEAQETCIISFLAIGLLVNCILGFFNIRHEINEVERVDAENLRELRELREAEELREASEAKI